jgi:hypothetical protein
MSVNGWFRVDPNSWHATGIAVGHPDRYKSRGVIRTTKDTSVPFEHQELGVPLKGKVVETEADKELHKLLKRQLETSVDQSYQKNSSRFSTSKIENVANYTPGLRTLEELKQDLANNKRPKLTNMNEKEVQIIVDKKKNEKRLATTEHLRREVVLQIQQKELQNEKTTTTALLEESSVPMSRHALEIERSLLVGKKKIPLAHLYVDAQDNPTKEIKTDLSPNIKFIELNELTSNHICIEEIRKMAKFSTYDPGVPSTVLCVKNLHKKVTEIDLLSIFLRFQSEKDKIKFKLMRGQAFITFPDIPTAQKALNLVNGYILKDRPMVIEYGKV